MLCSHQRVFAHSLFPSLYLNLSYLFLETYIPRSPTLYNGADTIYRGQSCLSCEGAVGSLASLPPRGAVALENRFTSAEEREIRSRAGRTEILLSLRRSPPPRGPASLWSWFRSNARHGANERRRDQDGDVHRCGAGSESMRVTEQMSVAGIKMAMCHGPQSEVDRSERQEKISICRNRR